MADVPAHVGAAAGCDLLILRFAVFETADDQKIAGFASSYGVMHDGQIDTARAKGIVLRAGVHFR